MKLSDVEKEISQVNATSLKCYNYGFFSAEGFESDVNEVIKYTLDDLYG